MNCKCCGAWFSSSDASQDLCAACRRALERVSPIIESLAAELEQVKQECDGLSIMLTTAESAAETYKRERDAYYDSMKGICATCKKARYCMLNPLPKCQNWQWRGNEDKYGGT